MKNILLVVVVSLMSTQSFAAVVAKCVDGSRSMVVASKGNKLVGRLVDFDLNLSKMNCSRIGNSKGYRCEQGEYYVDLFPHHTTGRLIVQVNLKGDFFPDSGYLHSLNCQAN